MGLSFFVQCWRPRESMLPGSSTLSEFCTSLSKVLTLWHCDKVKQRYLSVANFSTPDDPSYSTAPLFNQVTKAVSSKREVWYKYYLFTAIDNNSVPQQKFPTTRFISLIPTSNYWSLRRKSELEFQSVQGRHYLESFRVDPWSNFYQAVVKNIGIIELIMFENMSLIFSNQTKLCV